MRKSKRASLPPIRAALEAAGVIFLDDGQSIDGGAGCEARAKVELPLPAPSPYGRARAWGNPWGSQRKEKWERTFRLRTDHGVSKGLLVVLFWLWGIVGLLFNAGTLFGLTGSIGVGTSALLAASALIWIGGMVLFGIGALSLTQTLMVGPMAEEYRRRAGHSIVEGR